MLRCCREQPEECGHAANSGLTAHSQPQEIPYKSVKVMSKCFRAEDLTTVKLRPY